MSDEQYPWTRRTEGTPEHPRGESSQAYDAFRTYMNQGADRSLVKTAEALGKADSLVSRWCISYDWVARTAAYDSYLTTAKVDGEADAFAKVSNKHLEAAADLLDHLTASMKLWKPGTDPSIRWTTAFTAAAKITQTFLTLRETTSKTDEEAIARILDIVSKQAEG
jgi:arginine utilization protein RocB